MKNKRKDTDCGFDLLANSNGIVYYNKKTRACDEIAYPEDGDKPDEKELSSTAIDTISLPKVNACHCIIVKNVTSPDKYWVLHINPAEVGRNPFAFHNHTQGYDKLFADDNGITVDIIALGDINTDLFLAHCERNKVSIRNYKQIPFHDYFTIDGMTFGSMPRSIYIYFMPMQGDIVIVGHELTKKYQDKLAVANGRLTMHIATDVFAETKPLTFYFVGNQEENAGKYFEQIKGKLEHLTLALVNDAGNKNSLVVGFAAENKPMVSTKEGPRLDQKTPSAKT